MFKLNFQPNIKALNLLTIKSKASTSQSQSKSPENLYFID